VLDLYVSCTAMRVVAAMSFSSWFTERSTVLSGAIVHSGEAAKNIVIPATVTSISSFDIHVSIEQHLHDVVVTSRYSCL
jgi:hypothetical protein